VWVYRIIVLAESILGTVNGMADVKDKHPAAWIAFILGILITFLLWSLYFDMTSEQETKRGYHYMQWFIFLHFPVLAGLGIVGACLRILLAEIENNSSAGIYWIFCVAIATILFMIVAITFVMKEAEEDRSYIKPVSRLLVISGLLILVVPLFAIYLETIAFLSVIAIILFLPVFIGTRSWVGYKFFGKR